MNGAKQTVPSIDPYPWPMSRQFTIHCTVQTSTMASAGTSASKRQDRFHGAFTGGFSAGFYNSVRMKSLVPVELYMHNLFLYWYFDFVFLHFWNDPHFILVGGTRTTIINNTTLSVIIVIRRI